MQSIILLFFKEFNKFNNAGAGILDSIYHDCDINITVNPVLSGHSKIDKTNILMTNSSLMNVESIAECSPWSILQYF